MNPTSKTENPEPETSHDSTPETAGATGPEAGTTERRTDSPTDAVPAARTGEGTAGAGTADTSAGLDEDDDALDAALDAEFAAAQEAESRPSGLGSAAASILALALGIIALTGTWTGKVFSEREQIASQVKMGQGASGAEQISELYGDPWHVIAAANGIVALVALVIGATVLALPQRTAWVRPFALAGAILGFLGVLVSIGMYFDLFAAIPVPPAPAAPPAP